MFDQTFAIERGGPKRLLVRRRWRWKQVEPVLDGQSLGSPVPNMATLRSGRGYKLPDGRELFLSFQKKFIGSGLALTLDGRPVAGAANDPRMAVRGAGKLLWFLAGLNLLIGLAAYAARDDEGAQTMAITGGAVAVLFAGLGFAVYRYRSRLALAVAVLIEVADGVALFALREEGDPPPTNGLVMRVIIIVVLVRALRAVAAAHRLDRDEKVEDAFR